MVESGSRSTVHGPRNETLSSRERVIRTLHRLPVDRMPIDLGSHMSSGISAFAYWNLLEHLGFSTDDVWVPDVVQFLAKVEENVRKRFHLDCICIEPQWPAMAVWNPRGKYRFHIPAAMKPEKGPEGEWFVRRNADAMRLPAGGFFFDGSWISNWGGLDEDDAIALYAKEAERIFKETPYATNYMGYSYGGGYGAYFGGGNMEMLMRMVEDPDGVIADNAKKCDDAIRRVGKVIDAMGKHIQLITIGDDMGTQSGPMCRPSTIEQCCAPFIKKFCDFIHRNSDIKVFMHCCGSIKPVIPILIESGVDVLNPVQISAKDMDPETLKKEFGDKMIFWGGGCDTQNVLGVKTPKEVADHVRSLVRIFKKNGGFVFNQVHNIMGNVPPENIVAMMDAAYEEGFYNN